MRLGTRVLTPPAPLPRTNAQPAILLALLFAGAALLSLHWIYESDFWWHLAQGRELAAGSSVSTNVFSANFSTYPQPYVSWLFDLAVYEIWTLGGAVAIQFAQGLLVACTLIALYFACRHRSGVPAIVTLEAFGVFVIEARIVPRPHIASMALMAVAVLFIEIARTRRSVLPLLWTIPLIALWSNVHAECLFGASLVGIFAAGEFLRPSSLTRRQAALALAIAAACLAACMANPSGAGLFRYLLENQQSSQVVQIAEFKAAYLPVYAPFFVYLFAGAALIVWQYRKRALSEMLAFGAFALLALLHLRFITLFFCVSAPIVAASFSRLLPAKARMLIPVTAAIVAGLLLSPLPLDTRIQRLGVGPDHLEPPEMLSSSAISFIRSSGLKGPLFNSNNLGGYLIWNLYPSARVFQDGRFQSYPPSFFLTIHNAYHSQEDWDKLVAGFDWAVLSLPHYAGALSGAGRFPEAQWAVAYRDRAFLVLVRRSGKFASLADHRR